MPTQFDSDLGKLKEKLLQMGAIAEQMIHNMSLVLINRETDLLTNVYKNEAKMDLLQRELDEETVKLIGIHTPVAGDLRLLLMVSRINAEIERIGDKVVDIGYTIENFILGKNVKTLVDFTHIAYLAENMLHNALNAFVNNSDKEALSIITADDKIDQLTDQTVRALFTHMFDNKNAISYVFGFILIAQAMEKIADHAVNICEDIVYIVEGKDIRHLDNYHSDSSD